MQRWVCSVLTASLAVVPAVAAAETDPFTDAAVLDREDFLAAVLASNPGLAAARQALRAAEARAPQARALMDPTVSTGLAPLSVGRPGAVDPGYEIRVEQMLPYPDKRRLRAAAADSEAAIAVQEFERVRQDLSLRASLLFAAWYRVHRALEVNAEHNLLVSDFQEVATARYAAGLAGPQDPLQAESELADLQQQQILLASEREIAAAEMNALLHRAPEVALPPPPAELPELASALAPAAELEAEALASRPEIRALDAMVRARETAAALARLEWRPDFGVMASYNSMWSDSEHRLMVGGTLNLPVRKSRIRAAITEAEARLQVARSERAAAEDQVRREVAVAAVRLRESHHLLEILSSRRVPAARDRVEAAVAGFTTGQNDFAALIDAARNLRAAELEVSTTLADLQGRHAELRRAVGRLPVPERTVSDLAPHDTEGAIR